MRIGLTKWQRLLVFGVLIFMLAFLIGPNYGPPNFRYTGSDPENHVWNFGWPVSTFILDSNSSSNVIVYPFWFLIVSLALCFVSCLYVFLILWNNRSCLNRKWVFKFRRRLKLWSKGRT